MKLIDRIRAIKRNCDPVSFNKETRIFNNITTNINKTAIAPTQTIRKTRGRYSSSNKKRIQEMLQKQTMRNNAEFKGFLVRITIREEIKHNEERVVKKKKF